MHCSASDIYKKKQVIRHLGVQLRSEINEWRTAFQCLRFYTCEIYNICSLHKEKKKKETKL